MKININSMAKTKIWTCMLLLLVLLAMVPSCAGAAKIKAISAGAGSMVLMDDGTVYAWGNNASHSVPEKVQGLTNITAISTYRYSYMALKNDGTVYVWTWIDDSPPRLVQVPITGVKAISVPVMLKDDGTVWEVGPLRNPNFVVDPDDANPTVSVRQVVGLDNVKAIGYYVALEGDGSVWVWGLTRNNTLGDPLEGDLSPVRVNISDVKAVAATAIGGMALKDDGTVWSWGQNYGQFGNGKVFNGYYTGENITRPVTDFNVYFTTPVQAIGLDDVVSISTTCADEMALKDDGTIWLWGINQYNVLGIFSGDVSDPQLLYTPRKLDSLSNIVAISMDDGHCMAVKSDGTLWAWGANYAGQLGDGTVTPPWERNGGKDKPVKVLIDTSGPYTVSASPTARVTATYLPAFNVSVSPASSIVIPSAGSKAEPATNGLSLGDGPGFTILAFIALIIASVISLALKKK